MSWTRRLPLFLATWMLAAVVVEPAWAGDFIVLKDGTVVTGHLLHIDDFEITGLVDPDGEETTFKREDLRPGSWYMARTRTAGDDAAARMELARFCMANNLYGNAKAELEHAVELDETLLEQAKPIWLQAHDAAGAELLRLAQSSIKKGKYQNAKRLASMILTQYEDTGSAEQAARILDEMVTREETSPSMKKRIHQPLTEQEVDEMRESDPRYIEAKKHLDRARKRNLDGLKEKSQSKSKQLFEGAIHDYTKLLSILDRVLEEEKDQPVIVGRVTEFRPEVVEELVSVHVNLGSMLATRGSYQQALEVANKAVAMAPENKTAQSFRRHVGTLSAISSSGRGWRR